MIDRTIGLGPSVLQLSDQRIDALDLAERLGRSRTFAQTRTGFVKLSRVSSAADSLEMGITAAQDLIRQTDVDLDKPGVLTVVTQNPPQYAIPHLSAVMHSRLTLPSHWSVFDIGLGCSGFVHALSIIKAFMKDRTLTNGIILTLDHYSTILQAEDVNTQLIFGDGATASLVTAEQPMWFIGATDFRTNSSRTTALERPIGGSLRMDGRAVFDFGAKEVPASIRRVLEMEGLEDSDIDEFLLHQGSRYIVEALQKRLPGSAVVRFGASEYGNLVSSSIPALLAAHAVEIGNRVIASGFGVGLAVASVYLERNSNDRR